MRDEGSGPSGIVFFDEGPTHARIMPPATSSITDTDLQQFTELRLASCFAAAHATYEKMRPTRLWSATLAACALLLSCRLGYDELTSLGSSAGNAPGSVGGSAGMTGGGGGASAGSAGSVSAGSSGVSGAQSSAGGNGGMAGGTGAVVSQAGAGGEPSPGAVGLGGGTVVSFGMRSGATYQVGNDTYVNEEAPTVTYGAAPTVFASAITAARQTALLYFDVSALAPGTTITGAELDLRTNADAFQYGEVTAYALLEGWVDAEATWNERSTGVAWTTPGAGAGSRSSALLAQFAAPDSLTDYQVPLPAALVQGWVDAVGSNFGLALEGTTDMTEGQFISADAGSATGRPLLLVSAQ